VHARCINLILSFRENEFVDVDEEYSFNNYLNDKKALLLTTFWDEHAYFLTSQNVDAGTYVLIRNLHTLTTDQAMIAALHGEKPVRPTSKQSNHIKILAPSDTRLLDLKK
jgi:hypothetical protein